MMIFQMYGHNLARQRDKLIRGCLEDLCFLQGEVEKTKASIGAIATDTISTFLIYHVYQLMHYHFDLGFRLELFVPYEFAYIFWYANSSAHSHFVAFVYSSRKVFKFRYFSEIVSKNVNHLLERIYSLIVYHFGRSTFYQSNNVVTDR